MMGIRNRMWGGFNRSKRRFFLQIHQTLSRSLNASREKHSFGAQNCSLLSHNVYKQKVANSPHDSDIWQERLSRKFWSLAEHSDRIPIRIRFQSEFAWLRFQLSRFSNTKLVERNLNSLFANCHRESDCEEFQSFSRLKQSFKVEDNEIFRYQPVWL